MFVGMSTGAMAASRAFARWGLTGVCATCATAAGAALVLRLLPERSEAR